MTTAHDAWLEKPFQDACRESDRYDAAFEQEETTVRARLEQLTIAELLRETDGFSAEPNSILQLSTREPLNPAKPASWSLDSIIGILAQQEAKHNLETAQPTDDDYGPDEEDWTGSNLMGG